MRAQKVHGELEGSGDVGTAYFEVEGSDVAKEMSTGEGEGKKGRWGRGSGYVYEMEGERGSGFAHEVDGDRGIELAGLDGREKYDGGPFGRDSKR